MPPESLAVVYWVDGALLACGALFCLAWIFGYVRRNGLADPLAAARLPREGPSPPVAIAVFFGFFLVLMSGLPLRLTGGPLTESPLAPGSHEWFRAHTAFGATQIVFILLAWRCLPREPRITAPGRWLAGLTLLALACTLVANVQARASKITLENLAPSMAQPQHDVLLALESPAWGVSGVVMLVIAAVVYVPMFEEAMYRGVLLTSLWSVTGRAWLANVFTAVFFGIMHWQQPYAVLPLIGFGLVLGFVRLRTGSLLACIVLHALFNARTMTLALLFPDLIRSGY